MVNLEEALKKHPVHISLGKKYMLSKQFKKARYAYQKVIELDPESDLAEQAKTYSARISKML